MHIHRDDTVQILTGDDKGKRGRVLRVMADEGKILVEGINRVYKHLKPSRRNPQGGRLSKEMPVAISNVALICPQTNKPTRVGVRFLADGSKERFSKRSAKKDQPGSGASMGKIAPPRKHHAAKS